MLKLQVGTRNLQDADTPEDYHQLIERHNRQPLRPMIEISHAEKLHKDSALLFLMIDYTGTVKALRENADILTAKWNMLSTLRKTSVFPIMAPEESSVKQPTHGEKIC